MFPQDTHTVMTAVHAAYADAYHRQAHPEAAALCPTKYLELARLTDDRQTLIFRSAYESARQHQANNFAFSVALVTCLGKHTRRVHFVGPLTLVEV